MAITEFKELGVTAVTDLTVLQHRGFRSRGHQGGGGRWRVAVRISACLLDQMKWNDMQTDTMDIIRNSSELNEMCSFH